MERRIRSITIENGDFASHGDTFPILQVPTSLDILKYVGSSRFPVGAFGTLATSPHHLPRPHVFELRDLVVDLREVQGLQVDDFAELRGATRFHITLEDVE